MKQQIMSFTGKYDERMGCGKTEVLEKKRYQRNTLRIPFLIRRCTQEKILINRDVFRLGKDKKRVDYDIDNEAVSRKHAEIIRKKDGFYVVDKNSLNHTFLEGRQLPIRQKVKLESGQSLTLGNEEFTFYYEAL